MKSKSQSLAELIKTAGQEKWNALAIEGKEVFEIPKEIGDLRFLLSLTIGNTSIKNLPQGLFQLNNLRSLYISDLESSTLSPSIKQLARLEKLIIHNTDIETLPPEIGFLENLKRLEITDSKLNLISPNIGRLQKLEALNFDKNQIEQIPDEIGYLINLRQLSLVQNNISSLPDSLTKLINLKRLNLLGNKLSIPFEILGKLNEPSQIINYYVQFHKETKRPLLQAKILIVGQGSVGKTSIVQQILHNTFNQNQTKTEGISINQWQVEGGEKRETEGQSKIVNQKSKIKLNLWDFGGQEIMHATHQFFLTKRSLYLLVLDARLTQEENRVEYWLKIIQSFGGESPVLIVGNKTDQHPLDIDRTGLQKKYPNIVGILETSAATGAGIEALKAEIAKQVDTLPHVRDLLPETWFTVKSKLEELGRDKNFITQDEYLNLCGANDVTDEISQHTLIGFLHDLGVVLHFQDDPRLEALGILNPQWVTNGVYKILNSHELFQNQGTLTLPILNKTLNPPEYPSNKRLFIVDMMKKFELCYDIEPDKSFLIPDLLPKDEPFTGEWDGALAFQFHYNVLPSSIISRFIVRMNAFVHKTVWRAGVVLKNGGNTALVKADIEDRKISIWVNGDENTRRDLLSAIRIEFDTIHKTIVKIEAMQKVPHPDYPELILDYDELIEFERQGVTEFPKKVGNQIVKCTVRELLDGIRPAKTQTAKVFISYGHEDKTFVKKLAGELTKANIETWWDFDALRGGHDWQKEIQRGIKLCDYFVVVLSPNSVERDWVLKEITFANEYKKKIIPLKLQECERPISIIEKQYIDFEKQTQKAAIKELVKLLKT